MNKKTRIVIPFIAIMFGVILALAFRPKQGCLGLQQYYFDGTNYHPAGTIGKNYICGSGSGTCTYYLLGISNYEPCQSGVYLPLRVASSKK